MARWMGALASGEIFSQFEVSFSEGEHVGLMGVEEEQSSEFNVEIHWLTIFSKELPGLWQTHAEVYEYAFSLFI